MLAWERDRSLFGITQGDNAISYTYDADGIRTSKTVNGATTTYILDGSTILGEKRSDGTTIRYLYDESGTPYAFFYNSQVYYYVYNAQGDVIEIMSTSGSDIAWYKYDAWGNVIGIGGDESIAELNPIRYRGYYYDNETGFYYLNSRYYDPEIGRFINADDVGVLDGGNNHILENNLFIYCFNNPVNMQDDTGNWPQWATKLLIGAAVIATAAAVTIATGGAGAGVVGFIAAGALKGAVLGGTLGAAVGAAGGAIGHRISTGSWEGAGKAILESAADGFMSGSITGAVTGGAGRLTQTLRNTQISGKLGKTGKPLSSQSMVKNGKVTNTRFYNAKGKATFQLDYTNHGYPKYHSVPHGHKINFSSSVPWSKPINSLRNLRW